MGSFHDLKLKMAECAEENLNGGTG